MSESLVKKLLTRKCFTINENSPSKLATAPVVESKTIFAPGIGLLSSSTTVPETLVCAKMKVLSNTAIRDKILFMIKNLVFCWKRKEKLHD